MDNKKRIQENLEQKLKRDWFVDKEMSDIIYSSHIDNVMKNIESIRKKRLKEAPNIYTQKNVAEKAGIKLSTYQAYLHGGSYSIKFITILKFADILHCSLEDILKSNDTNI